MAGGSGKTMLSLALMGCFRRALVETRTQTVELPTPAGWVLPVNEVSVRISPETGNRKLETQNSGDLPAVPRFAR